MVSGSMEHNLVYNSGKDEIYVWYGQVTQPKDKPPSQAFSWSASNEMAFDRGWGIRGDF